MELGTAFTFVQNQYSSLGIDVTGAGGGLGGRSSSNNTVAAAVADPAAADRFPQWSFQETRDFLMIRQELDPSFTETKRNKLLWETVSTRMREKGYNRNPDQCKCKWKNLITRYKGCETVELEGMRQQFPFYDEIQAIFSARMERMMWMEAETGGSSSRKLKSVSQLSSDDEEEDTNDKEISGDGGGNEKVSIKKRKKMMKMTSLNQQQAGSGSTTGGNNNVNNGNLRELMEDFMKQQLQVEMQWMKTYKAREEERRVREIEWRQAMEALEKERMLMEIRWKEREEQRRFREEARAERRDALISALLNKIRKDSI